MDAQLASARPPGLCRPQVLIRVRGSPFLEGHVGVQVDLRRLNSLVAEPERDDRCVDAAFQQLHGAGVAEDVRGDGLSSERWLPARRRCRVVAKEAPEGVRAETATVPTRKEQAPGRPTALSEPGS